MAIAWIPILTLYVQLATAAPPPKAIAFPACPAGASPRTTSDPSRATEFYCQRRSDSGDFVNHGPYRKWDAAGLPLESGQYLDGKRVGVWRVWHEVSRTNTPRPPHRLAAEGQFVDGLRTGLLKLWDDEGQLISSVAYERGVRHGTAETWWGNGHPKTRADFVEGKGEGPVRTWHENGQPNAEYTARQDAPDGLYSRWFDDGRVEAKGSMANGMREGEWTLRYRLKGIASQRGDESPDGEYTAIGAFQGDVQIGRWKVERPDGSTDSVEFKAGVLDGPFVRSAPDGTNLVVGSYVDGLAQGRWTAHPRPRTTAERWWEMARGGATSCYTGTGCTHPPSVRYFRYEFGWSR